MAQFILCNLQLFACSSPVHFQLYGIHGGIMSELNTVVHQELWESVREAAAKLAIISPRHELLQYFRTDHGDLLERMDFRGRFAPTAVPTENSIPSAEEVGEYMLMAFHLALNEACFDPEKEIVIDHAMLGDPDMRADALNLMSISAPD